MASEVKSVQERQKFFRKEIRQIDSWQEWKEQWGKAVLKEELLELLHCGFSVTGAPPAERACLYLEIADGYRDVDNFVLEAEKNRYGHSERPEPAMRLEVAQKALRMLVDKLFVNTRKPNRYVYQYPSWAGTVACQPMLDKVLWFFDVKRLSFEQERNLPDDSDKHDDVVLRKFIEDFIVFCWQFHGFGNDDAEPEGNAQLIKTLIETLEDLRPRLLELMHATDQLWYLVHNPRPLDKDSVGKLREIALRQEGLEDGPYTTLAEAYAGGRLAAVILLLDPIWKAELERQEKLKKAEELARQAEQLKREANRR